MWRERQRRKRVMRISEVVSWLRAQCKQEEANIRIRKVIEKQEIIQSRMQSYMKENRVDVRQKSEKERGLSVLN